MIIDLPPTTYIAQVYNCDTYGAAAYNECLETADAPSTSTPSSTPSTSRQSQQTTTGDDTVATSDEPTTTGTTQQPAPSYQLKPAPSPEKEITLVTPANTIAGMGWTVIVPIALVLSVLIALIILLFKRRRRNQAY